MKHRLSREPKVTQMIHNFPETYRIERPIIVLKTVQWYFPSHYVIIYFMFVTTVAAACVR